MPPLAGFSEIQESPSFRCVMRQCHSLRTAEQRKQDRDAFMRLLAGIEPGEPGKRPARRSHRIAAAQGD